MLEPCIDEHMTRKYYSTFVLSIQTCSSLLSESKRSIWASLSSQSNTWVFAMIRDGVSDLGKGMKLVRQHSLVLWLTLAADSTVSEPEPRSCHTPWRWPSTSDPTLWCPAPSENRPRERYCAAGSMPRCRFVDTMDAATTLGEFGRRSSPLSDSLPGGFLRILPSP